MWLACALITTLVWGVGELFYKKGSHADEKYSHLKVNICVGAVMGLHAVYTLVTKDINYDPINLIRYAPVSLLYIISMTCSFFGIRFIEESLADPLENTSGAICSVMAVVLLGEGMATGSFIPIILIVIGVVGIGIFERRGETDRRKKLGKVMAVVAFAMPFGYALLDALGSFLDIYFLEITTSPLINVTEATIEEVANTSYELTYAIVAILSLLFIWARGEKFNASKQGDKLIAGICETAGQYTYVFAMSGNGAVSAPILSAVCVVSLLLSRIFLKEKLTKGQYLFITMVIVGIMGLAALNGDA